jgi:hypothetical protein
MIHCLLALDFANSDETMTLFANACPEVVQLYITPSFARKPLFPIGSWNLGICCNLDVNLIQVFTQLVQYHRHIRCL